MPETIFSLTSPPVGVINKWRFKIKPLNGKKQLFNNPREGELAGDNSPPLAAIE